MKNPQQSWPKRLPSARTGSVGVLKTALFFENEAHWLFREQFQEDYGIDAHVEIVEGDYVKGRLVALQIKSGDEWLRPSSRGGWDFYPKPRHVTYWQNHSLPVAVVIWHESTDTLYFKEASAATLEKTLRSGWKIHFSDSDVLGRSSIPILLELSQGTAYDLRLRELRLVLPWMARLREGQRIIVDVEEWVNKTWGKGQIEIVAIDRKGVRCELGVWAVVIGGEYSEVLPKVFEWAKVTMNPDVLWELADGLEPYDEETEGLRPYSNSMDEVDHWSLELRLNDLALAFLAVDEYARTGRLRQLSP